MDIATNMITQEAHPDATIIWGANIDESLNDEMRITVIAAGFNDDKKVASADVEETPAADNNDDNNEEDFGVLVDLFTKKK